MSTRTVTVSCADHGDMERDLRLCMWLCPATGCTARLPNEEVYRLAASAPAGSPDLIVVT